MKEPVEMNKRAARKLADEKDFDPENVLVCVGCGRTVVRSQNLSNPGMKDKMFCTCDSRGLPMVKIVEAVIDND